MRFHDFYDECGDEYDEAYDPTFPDLTGGMEDPDYDPWGMMESLYEVGMGMDGDDDMHLPDAYPYDGMPDVYMPGDVFERGGGYGRKRGGTGFDGGYGGGYGGGFGVYF
jgi:hypothetical protein